MKPVTTAIVTTAALIVIAEFGWDLYRGYRLAYPALPTFRVHARQITDRDGWKRPKAVTCPACAGSGRRFSPTVYGGFSDIGYCRACDGGRSVPVASLGYRIVEVGEDEPNDYRR